jgi:glycosyltransferase involved in cell wall biosynthesis
MDRANHGLAMYLAARGDLVHLVTHRAWPDLEAMPTVRVHKVPRPWNKHTLGGPLLARAGASLAKRMTATGARVLTNGGNCVSDDINWVHYVHAAWSPMASGGLMRRLKAAVSSRQHRAAEQSRIGRARLVIANSERTRHDLINLVGTDPSRTRTIYYGIDAERFRPPSEAERAAALARMGWSDGRPVVAFVGAMGDRRKGFDSLFSAWAMLAAEPSWDAKLVVLGAGASLPEWKARAESQGLSGSITFLGFRKDVSEVLAGCDVLVSPVRYEAYGLNVQEALCCGLPALVSASAGAAERFPETLRGLLLPDPEDATDLANRLRSWRDRMDAIRALVAPLSDLLRARTWDVMARELAEAAGEA